MKLLTRREIIGLVTLLLLVGVVAIGGHFTKSFERRAVEDIEVECADSVERLSSVEVIPLEEFDPNTVSYSTLRSFGLARREALSIIRYRNYGKVYRFREDILSCYDVSDSLYALLEPYITIGEEFEYKPEYKTRSYSDEKGVSSNSPKEVITSSQKSSERERVDLNRADSAALRSVWGIGEKSVVAIIDYRTRLGGFHSVEQLAEIDVISEANYEKIIEQISLESYDISKIDVNFASAKALSHPYISGRVLRKLLRHRELKGGWSTVEEMITDDILTQEEATKLRPYLIFTVQSTRVE